jgi:CBS domain-containing protein
MVTKVKDVMIGEVITVEGATPLIEALQLMLDKSVKSLVIPPRNETDAFAILTFTDIARKVLAQDERLEMLNVFDIMQKPCLYVHEDLDIRHAAKILTSTNIHRAVVSDGKQLQGIVSLTDMVKCLHKGKLDGDPA